MKVACIQLSTGDNYHLNFSQNLKLIKMLPDIDKFTSKKTSEFYKFLR